MSGLCQGSAFSLQNDLPVFKVFSNFAAVRHVALFFFILHFNLWILFILKNVSNSCQAQVWYSSIFVRLENKGDKTCKSITVLSSCCPGCCQRTGADLVAARW